MKKDSTITILVNSNLMGVLLGNLKRESPCVEIVAEVLKLKKR